MLLFLCTGASEASCACTEKQQHVRSDTITGEHLSPAHWQQKNVHPNDHLTGYYSCVMLEMKSILV
jgi:hypothetical protein